MSEPREGLEQVAERLRKMQRKLIRARVTWVRSRILGSRQEAQRPNSGIVRPMPLPKEG